MLAQGIQQAHARLKLQVMRLAVNSERYPA
jgi:hypothetical protein